MSDSRERGSRAGTARDENRLADYRAGRLSPEERRSFEESVLASDELAAELYAETSLDAALETARKGDPSGTVAGPERWWRRREVGFLVPLAAAALLLLVLRGPGDDDGSGPAPPTFRGEDAVARCVSPIGDLAAPPARFVWTRDPAAAMYRFELRDISSELLFRTTTSDTTLEVAADAWDADSFVEGYWKVVPMSAAGVERAKAPPALIRVTRP
jgi:hypothetical protein